MSTVTRVKICVRYILRTFIITYYSRPRFFLPATHIACDMDIIYGHSASLYLNKKDGYRQQNVRQRQKLISIIDYDVCMTFY